MSIHEINLMVQELGYKEAIFYCCLEPKTTLDKRLRNLQRDLDVLGMCKWVYKYTLIDIYCDHRHLSEIFKDTFEDFNEANSNSDSTFDDEHFTDDDEYCVDDQLLGPLSSSMSAFDNEPLSNPLAATIETDKHVNVTTTEDEQDGKENGKKRKQGNNNRSASFAAQPDPSNAGGKSNVEDLPGENMVNDELYSTYGSSEEDVEHNMVRYVDFRVDRDMRRPRFELGMKFALSEEFKKAIRNYFIWKGKPVKPYTNKNHRARAKCKPPCKWEVYASKVTSLGTNDLVIKTLNDVDENCNHA
ncbi:hypothetical protein ACH5RR_006381 [Cinchona calisaya]|uniref:Transposase MuDR plant domain-containing protein n=1 Tax=Cinchona calisaya TaxID=153742 RepID=A0ABD3ANU3_9GENT